MRAAINNFSRWWDIAAVAGSATANTLGMGRNSLVTATLFVLGVIVSWMVFGAETAQGELLRFTVVSMAPLALFASGTYMVQFVWARRGPTLTIGTLTDLVTEAKGLIDTALYFPYEVDLAHPSMSPNETAWNTRAENFLKRNTWIRRIVGAAAAPDFLRAPPHGVTIAQTKAHAVFINELNGRVIVLNRYITQIEKWRAG